MSVLLVVVASFSLIWVPPASRALAPEAAFNFDIALEPNEGQVTAPQSLYHAGTVYVLLVSGSPTGPVSFDVALPLPTGVSIGFSPQICSPKIPSTITSGVYCESVFNIFTGGIQTAAPGVYTLTIIASSSGMQRSSNYKLTVISPQPPPSAFDFSISVSPTSGSVTAGQQVSNVAKVSLTLVSGSSQSVSVSVSGLPSNVGWPVFSTTSCSPSCTCSFSIQTVSSAPSGTYTITITGTGGGKTHSTTYTLTVNGASPPAQPCTYHIVQLTVSTSKPVYSVGDEVIVSWSPTVSETGLLTLTGPSGTLQFNLDQGTVSQGQFDVGTAELGDVGSWTAKLAVSTPGCPPDGVGSTSFQVGSTVTSCTMWLVQPQMKLSTSKSVYSVGDEVIVSWSPTVSETGLLTLTGPSGTLQFNLDQGTMNQGMADVGQTEPGDVGSWTATLTVPGKDQCGNAYLPGQTGFQVVSTQGTQTQVITSSTAVQQQTTTASATTNVPFDYSITAVSSSTQFVEVGGSTSYVVSVLPLAGNAGTVSLTVMGLPNGVRGSFTTPSGIPPYTSTLNLDLSNSAINPGSYTLTIVGAYAGGTIKTTTETLVIQQNTSTTTSDWYPVLQQYSPIIVALLAAVALAVLAIRGRRNRSRSAAPQQVGAPRTFCINCGAELPHDSKLCNKCGSVQT